ncbi:hypothetical protein SKAU_G00221470 [Synaphobranchus kaupii]|uniref:RING-type domain-containing protein n=1 Tax=Synaphobranchus kaupii TaxID=118154 RepID=A0A9Q1FB09_SYNKA|nr:hypothetical protein SKAU_G00221470 [Synaphobranchus kaupii]
MDAGDLSMSGPIMKSNNMTLLWRIFSTLTFDCLRRASYSAQRSPPKYNPARSASFESTSLNSSQGPESLHCQWCISFDVHLKRLSCGHFYCEPCSDHIVNLAFEDIEGLSDYPCPMCKSIHRLGSLSTPFGLGTPLVTPLGILKRQVMREERYGH